MDIAGLSSSMASITLNSQSKILVAKIALDQQKQEGQNSIALIQRAAPRVDNGNGKLINIYA